MVMVSAVLLIVCELFSVSIAAFLGTKDENVCHNMGLHLVSRISGSMTYQNTFGLNILTIAV